MRSAIWLACLAACARGGGSGEPRAAEAEAWGGPNRPPGELVPCWCQPPDEAPLSEPCADARWGPLAELPQDQTIYVAPSSEGDETGTMDQPLGSIQEALNRAARRGWPYVAVARGRYTEVLLLNSDHDGISLVGACRDGVEVVGPERPWNEWFQVEVVSDYSPTVTFEGVSFVGGERAGIGVRGAHLTLRDVTLRGQIGHGLLAESVGVPTQVELEDVRIEGVVGTNEGGQCGGGFSLVVGPDTEVTADGLEITPGTDGSAVFIAESGASLVASDCTIHGADGAGEGYGVGLMVAAQGRLQLSGCEIQDAPLVGVMAADAAFVGLHDVTITGTVPSNGPYDVSCTPLPWDDGIVAPGDAYGVYMSGTPSVELDRVAVAEQTDGVGVEILDSSGTFVDLSVTGLSTGINVTTAGLVVAGHAVIEAEDLLIDRVEGLGLLVSGADASLTVDGLDVRAVHVPAQGTGEMTSAWGVAVVDGARLDARDLAVADVQGGGVWVGDSDGDSPSNATISGCMIEDIALDAEGYKGYGMWVSDASSLAASDCTIQRTSGTGVVALDPFSALTLRDSFIADTAPSRLDAAGGVVAVVCNTSEEDCDLATAPGPGPTVTLEGVVISRTGPWAVLALGDRTTVDVYDTLIRDTYLINADQSGFALYAGDGARVSGSDLTVVGAQDVGAAFQGADGQLAALTVTDVTGGATYQADLGVVVTAGGTLAVDALTVERTDGPGLMAAEGVQVSLGDLRVRANGVADGTPAVVVRGGSLSAGGGSVDGGGLVGIYAQNSDGQLAQLTIDGVQIAPHGLAALYLDDLIGLEVWDSVLEGGPGYGGPSTADPFNGNALFVNGRDGARSGATLCVGGSELKGSGEAVLLHGVAEALDDCGAPVWDNAFSGNTYDLVEQDCGDDGAVVVTGDHAAGLNTLICTGGTRLIEEVSFELYLEEPVIDGLGRGDGPQLP